MQINSTFESFPEAFTLSGYAVKILFLSYHPQPAYKQAADWLRQIRKFAELMECLSEHHQVLYLKQTGFEERIQLNGVDYIFLKAPQRKNYFPVRLHKLIQQEAPDAVIISGIRFPLQIIQLRKKLGKEVILAGRHHAEKPPAGIRALLQRKACRSMNAFLFTSRELARPWIRAGLIGEKQTVGELAAASTSFKRIDKQMARVQTGVQGQPVFLWVGRLNANKDPLTVLKAFEQYLQQYPQAKLYMIYQEADLISEIEQQIAASARLQSAVVLVGKMQPEKLALWYSAADYYLSASFSEGGSFALLEAMACGCIPLVSAIPASLEMTGNGQAGLSFETGNAADLYEKMKLLSALPVSFSTQVEDYFQQHYSNEALAAGIVNLIRSVQIK